MINQVSSLEVFRLALSMVLPVVIPMSAYSVRTISEYVNDSCL